MGTPRLGPGPHNFLIHVGMSNRTAGWMRTPETTTRVWHRIGVATSTRGVAQPMTSHVVMGVGIVRDLHDVAMGGAIAGRTVGATAGRTVGANFLIPWLDPPATARVTMKVGSAGAPYHQRAGITCVMVHLCQRAGINCVLVHLCLLWTMSDFHRSLLLSGRRRDSFLIWCCIAVSR
jgi:hypothetical protein